MERRMIGVTLRDKKKAELYSERRQAGEGEKVERTDENRIFAGSGVIPASPSGPDVAYGRDLNITNAATKDVGNQLHITHTTLSLYPVSETLPSGKHCTHVRVGPPAYVPTGGHRTHRHLAPPENAELLEAEVPPMLNIGHNWIAQTPTSAIACPPLPSSVGVVQQQYSHVIDQPPG
ncbi:hypothetical protein HPB51_008613 [Rhipicephalus microplus]|uniref:Uncharacterized protein n=1 Tax=Rhipicephalus microplus TaxID=6941 RepID=A0A9J6EN16_RHIMP|nr:hypothetical protein HPB51_008613 [Rhipicephalus microplus]